MSRVFVVQRPAYFDRDRKGWVNKYDLTPAAVHGELVFLLRPGNIFRDRLDSAIERLEEVLADFSAEDFLLPTGDPVGIAAASHIAARNSGGILKVLKYDRMGGEYFPFVIDMRNDG
jgi:hypothetical protein